jgi:tRNA G18 (ribose-2'-O)-methylase SpoU
VTTLGREKQTFSNFTLGARDLDWDADATGGRGRKTAGSSGGGSGSDGNGREGSGNGAVVVHDGGSAAHPPSVVLCGVRDTRNIGSTYRLMACLNFVDMIHVGGEKEYRWERSDGGTEVQLETQAHSAKGCEGFVNRRKLLLPEYMEYLETHGVADRPPIVAVETASDAVNMQDFEWPESCQIMVGCEGTGIPPKVIKKLITGYDRLVIIPMPGPHKSLNVAMAWCSFSG